MDQDIAYDRGYEEGLARAVAALSEAIIEEKKDCCATTKILGFAPNRGRRAAVV